MANLNIKTKYDNVEIETNLNKDGELYSKLYVNFEKDGVEYYRQGEFLSFEEKKFLSKKYKFDFKTISTLDITKHIQYVEVKREENKYGVKEFINVHFDIGYDKKINIKTDALFLITQMYKQDNTSLPVKEEKK